MFVENIFRSTPDWYPGGSGGSSDTPRVVQFAPHDVVMDISPHGENKRENRAQRAAKESSALQKRGIRTAKAPPSHFFDGWQAAKEARKKNEAAQQAENAKSPRRAAAVMKFSATGFQKFKAATPLAEDSRGFKKIRQAKFWPSDCPPFGKRTTRSN